MQRIPCALALGALLLLTACGEAPDTIRSQQYSHAAAPGTVETASLPPGPNAGNMTAADMAPVPLASLPPVTDVTATTQQTTTTTRMDAPTLPPAVVKKESVKTKTVAVTVAPSPLPHQRVEIADLKFGLTQPDYAPILKSAVAAALAKNPNASFDVVVVTPMGGSDRQTDIESARAEFNGNTVMHAIMDYDVPVERINMSAAADAGASGTEVRVYTR